MLSAKKLCVRKNNLKKRGRKIIDAKRNIKFKKCYLCKRKKVLNAKNCLKLKKQTKNELPKCKNYCVKEKNKRNRSTRVLITLM